MRKLILFLFIISSLFSEFCGAFSCSSYTTSAQCFNRRPVLAYSQSQIDSNCLVTTTRGSIVSVATAATVQSTAYFNGRNIAPCDGVITSITLNYRQIGPAGSVRRFYILEPSGNNWKSLSTFDLTIDHTEAGGNAVLIPASPITILARQTLAIYTMTAANDIYSVLSSSVIDTKFTYSGDPTVGTTVTFTTSNDGFGFSYLLRRTIASSTVLGVTDGPNSAATTMGNTYIGSNSRATVSGYITSIQYGTTANGAVSLNRFFYILQYDLPQDKWALYGSFTIPATYVLGRVVTFYLNTPIFIQSGQYLAFRTDATNADVIDKSTASGTYSSLVGAPTTTYATYAFTGTGLAFSYTIEQPTDVPAACPGQSFCRWDPTLSQCLTGVPTDCVGYFNDVTGCQSRRPVTPFTQAQIDANCYTKVDHGLLTPTTTGGTFRGNTYFNAKNIAAYSGKITSITASVQTLGPQASPRSFYILNPTGASWTPVVYFTVPVTSVAGKIVTFNPSTPIDIQAGQALAIWMDPVIDDLFDGLTGVALDTKFYTETIQPAVGTTVNYLNIVNNGFAFSFGLTKSLSVTTSFSRLDGSGVAGTSSGTVYVNSIARATVSGFITQITYTPTSIGAHSNIRFFHVLQTDGMKWMVVSSFSSRVSNAVGGIAYVYLTTPVSIQAGQYLAVQPQSTNGDVLARLNTPGTMSVFSFVGTPPAGYQTFTLTANVGLAYSFKVDEQVYTPTSCPSQTCRWNYPNSTCLIGGPTTCFEYYNDNTGCTSNLFGSPQQCYLDGSSLCDSICNRDNTLYNCYSGASTAGGCQVDFNTYGSPKCLNGLPSSPCPTKFNATTCSSAGCMWDGFMPTAGKCLDSPSRSFSFFNCSYWSVGSVPSPNLSCPYHGCQLTTGTGVCAQAGSIQPGNDASLTIDYAFEANFINAVFNPLTGVLSYKIRVPLQVRLATPNNPIIGVGNYIETKNDLYTTPRGRCNSVVTSIIGNPIPVPTSTYSGTQAALLEYYITWVKANHNYNWDLGDSRGQALNMLFRRMNTSSDSLVTYIDITVDNAYVDYTVSHNIYKLIQDCGSLFGLTISDEDTVTYYNIPVTYVELNSLGGMTSSDYNFQIAMTDSGTTMFASAAQYKKVTELFSTNYNQSDCAIGWSRMVNVYKLTMQREFDVNYFTGVIRKEDITTFNGSNCYEDVTTSIKTNYPCTNQLCVTMIERVSHCRQQRVNGDSFDNCAYGPAPMIANAAAYGINMNAHNRHDFYFTPRKCPGSSLAPGPNQYAGCIVVSDDVVNGEAQNPNDPGDRVRITVTSKTDYPHMLLDVPDIAVDFGVLPNPNVFTISDYATTTTTYTGLQDVSSGAPAVVPVDGLLTFAVRIQNPAIRDVYGANLQIGVDELSFYFVPSFSNLTIEQIRTYPKLDWATHLHQYAIFTPRLAVGETSYLPACMGQIGCDGLSISVTAVQNVAIAMGLNATNEIFIDGEWTLILPGSTEGGGSGFRRLLQTYSTRFTAFLAIFISLGAASHPSVDPGLRTGIIMAIVIVSLIVIYGLIFSTAKRSKKVKPTYSRLPRTKPKIEE